jgi:hypothetical protein
MLVERRRVAYHEVSHFWTTYGAGLQSENGHGTFKYEFVEKMGHLHQDITLAMNRAIIHGKILDILGEQKKHMIQFECCLDAYNDYLGALSLLDVMFRHGMLT